MRTADQRRLTGPVDGAEKPVRPLCLLALASVLAVFAACGTDEPAGNTAKAPAAAADALTRTTEEGPVKATVVVSPETLRLGDRLTLMLTVEAESGVTIEMPAFGEALGRFAIVDFTPRRQTELDGRTVETQRYTLQAPMSGRQRIPPLRIEFLDERPGQGTAAAATYREILTDEIAVVVESVLPEGAVTDELLPVRATLDELSPGGLARWWPAIAGGLVAAFGLAAFVVYWRRRAVERARITAYDRAMRRIAVLESRGFPLPDEADGWYVELSYIVRHYLEDRYAVRAPELTTEEFLNEARRSPELSADHQDVLIHFLEQCDRVKFAAYHPEEKESKQVLDAARRFLEETRLLADAGTAVPERSAA